MFFIYVIIFVITSSQIFCKQAQPNQEQLKYEGTLTTLNNHIFSINDISITGKRMCIPVYQAPGNTETLIPKLTYNPKELKKIIRLADIKEIEILYPYTKWRYRHPRCGGTDSYLLIKIIWNDTKRAPTNFLIEPKRRLSGNIQKNDHVSPTKIPFSGFKKLTVSTMPR